MTMSLTYISLWYQNDSGIEIWKKNKNKKQKTKKKHIRVRKK